MRSRIRWSSPSGLWRRLRESSDVGRATVTAVKKHHRDLVEAIASRESEKARQLSEALPSEEYQEYSQYLAAVFAIFMEDFFGDKLSRDTIAGFAKRL